MPTDLATRRPLDKAASAAGASNQFVTTDWSLVSDARQGGAGHSDSLALLCQQYWFPLYADLRRGGYSTHDAEDLVQSFLAWIVAADLLRRADRERGRFRTFLRVALRQFCAREHRRTRAKKRHPSSALLSLDPLEAEARYEQALVCNWTPDRQFDHGWAMTLLQVTLQRLHAEYARAGNQARCESLLPFLTDDRRPDRDQCRARLGLTEAAFSMALGRLRRRYGKLLREEVARTVAHPDQIEDELEQILLAVAVN
ncbi:MAG: RNA polymerase subunit sigma-24 [Pirellulales bacterium]|nr:RNA polymerase subunit sigma-24 [Pirellulales bacterium]